MPKFQAIGKMVCLRQITKEDEVTKGGIHLPHRVRVNKHDICVVQSVGTEVKDVIVGDKVLIPYYDGEPIKVDGETYLLINEDKLIAKLEQE